MKLFRGPHGNVFTMSLDLKVLRAEGGGENFVLSINYCQLNARSTFSILYHLVKPFMIHTRNRDLFSIAEMIVSNIFSLQILYLYGRNLRQKSKIRGLLQFPRANFSSLYGLAKDLYSMLMTLKVLKLDKITPSFQPLK